MTGRVKTSRKRAQRNRFGGARLSVIPYLARSFREPQKVAQASCLFGADRLEACPTLQPADRFMAATHVLFWEVFAFHEPQGRAGCPRPAGPRRGEDTAPYLLAKFPASIHVRILEMFFSRERCGRLLRRGLLSAQCLAWSCCESFQSVAGGLSVSGRVHQRRISRPERCDERSGHPRRQ